MKPIPSFSLHRPENLEEALKLLSELEGSKPIAGGTDLLLGLRAGDCKAKHLVDLGLVKELRYIREDEGMIRIGSTTALAQVVESRLINAKAPVLSKASSLLGSVQIRNLATMGGNLCNASPGADTAPPLLVLGAEVAVASREGLRSMPLSELFTGPNRTSLIPGELLTEICFPVPPVGYGASFQKLGRRKGCTLSLINAAAYLEMNGEACREARVAFGACAPTPVRVHDVEGLLKGVKLDIKAIEGVSSACYRLVQPSTRAHARASEEYRREMSCVLMRRALTEAYERARRNTR
ncbi:MAG: xanthine dehydrogenase family protein subunit M [Candidatus Bathyarchaeota archaeon]|nr:xanthine dehydrogenase family protein subunit M [Candidatus Bathyarchaeota archaeon]